MIEAVAGLGALVPLALALLERYYATAPKRQRQELENAYEQDVQRANAALVHGDPNALTQLFDEERQEGIRRGDSDPRGPDADRMRGGYAGTDQQ